jgi:hypothetical protein
MHFCRTPRHRSRIAALAVLCAVALTGCGEIAFRRGSGPDAFAADRQACQARDPAPDSVRACLSQAGWTVTNLEPATPPASAEPPPAPATAAATHVEPATAPDQRMQSAVVHAPPHTILVGSWWKFGAGTADLRSTVDACVAKLGPANAPDAGLHSVTPALFACLRGGGWHGFARPSG